MKAGTSKQRKYIPVHDIRLKLSFSNDVFEKLIPFHAITGYDTVSYFAGHSKTTAWKLFKTDSYLLKDLGKGGLASATIKEVEQFGLCAGYTMFKKKALVTKPACLKVGVFQVQISRGVMQVASYN